MMKIRNDIQKKGQANICGKVVEKNKTRIRIERDIIIDKGIVF